MFKIVERRNWLFLLSALIIIPGLVFLTQYGLRLGNDFAGGSRLDIKVAEADMGRVIGKQGRIAKAIRVVMRAAAVRQGEKVIVEID